MIIKDIAHTCGDKKLTGYLADGSNGKKAPGVLLIHQGGGLTEHTKERARMLGELGYVAFCADLYGEVATSREHAMALLTELGQNGALLQARAKAGLEVLKVQLNTDAKRLAAIGYCFGGYTVLELSRESTEYACIVSFHPGLQDIQPADPRPVHCKVMVCAGEKDPLIPAQARERFIDQMKAANADWQLLTYGQAGHSFTDKSVDAMGIPNFNYHEATDKRSWAAMCTLFEETFGKM